MFSIPHLIIIFVVVLVVFGPEKLPELARNIGKIMGEFRRATGDLQHTFEDHLRDIERESSLRQPPTPAGTTIAPPAQNTISPPKTDSASAPGTVPSDAPHGWTLAPPDPSAGEKEGAQPDPSAASTGVTQADVAHAQPDVVKLAQEPAVSPRFDGAQSNQGSQQADPDKASAASVAEPGHEKGSDGGSAN